MALPRRLFRARAAVVVAATLSLAAVGPASPQSPAPVFPGRVELVAVDVHVTDREGRPVEDLQPGDFEVTVGGRARRVVSADLVRYAAPTTTPRGTVAAGAAPAPPPAASNLSPPGRLVVIVPDSTYLTRAAGHAASEAGKRFLSRLSPADRVALLTLPVGPKVDFTADHARVAEALEHVIGGFDGSFQDAPSRGGSARITLAEAFALVEDYDLGVREEAVVRNCGAPESQLSGGRGNSCVQDLERRGRRIQMEAAGKTAATLGTLRALFEALAPVPGEKTVVLVTQGLVVGAALGVVESAHEMRDVAALAAKARVTLHVIQVDRGITDAFDVSRRDMPHTVGEDARVMAVGAEVLAGETGGELFRAVVTPDRAFDRLALQTSAAWLLSFEPAAGDADGKPHPIRVKVRRPGVTVRARPQFVVAAPEVLDAAARLQRALDAPLAMPDIPLAVAGYVVGEPEEGRVRVLLGVAAVGAGPPPGGAVAAYRVLDAQGRVAGRSTGEAILEAAAPGAIPYFGTAFAVPAGTYTVKVAVTSASGAVGSLEHVIDARLRPAGPVTLSDIVLADPVRRPDGGVTLETDGHLVTPSVRAYIEVRTARPREGPTAPPDVRFEIGPVGGGPAERMTGALVSEGRGPGEWRAEGTVDLAGLAKSAYELRAVVMRGGDEVARLSRPVVLD